MLPSLQVPAAHPSPASHPGPAAYRGVLQGPLPMPPASDPAAPSSSTAPPSAAPPSATPSATPSTATPSTAPPSADRSSVPVAAAPVPEAAAASNATSDAAASDGAASSTSTSNGLRQPDYTLKCLDAQGQALPMPTKGRQAESGCAASLSLVVRLPLCESPSEVDVMMDADSIQVEARGKYAQLKVPLPYTVDESKGDASFNSKRRRLTVKMHVAAAQPTA